MNWISHLRSAKPSYGANRGINTRRSKSQRNLRRLLAPHSDERRACAFASQARNNKLAAHIKFVGRNQLVILWSPEAIRNCTVGEQIFASFGAGTCNGRVQGSRGASRITEKTRDKSEVVITQSQSDCSGSSAVRVAGRFQPAKVKADRPRADRCACSFCPAAIAVRRAEGRAVIRVVRLAWD